MTGSFNHSAPSRHPRSTARRHSEYGFCGSCFQKNNEKQALLFEKRSKNFYLFE
jgi:hypothetical protein